MRFFLSAIGALLITIAVFLFMRGLIEGGQREDPQVAVYENIEVVRQDEPKEEVEPDNEPPPEPAAEPVMEALQVAAPSPQPAPEPEAPALDLAVGDIRIQGAGKSWSAPLGAGTVEVGVSGEDGRGYVEVIPFNTRRPNVPEVAWRNKISGWVLVAFTVRPDGHTQDVRILDAKPRGVFEDKVIAAVQDWQYRLQFSGRDPSSVTLTQKVEVEWQNYPQNLPNVD